MATDAAEFTFPTTNPAHSPIDSPPLWCLSPTASPTPSHHQQSKNRYSLNSSSYNNNGDHLNMFSPRKSCSYIEAIEATFLKRLNMPGGCDPRECVSDQEEKMDMLWEDLNEEFSKNRGEKARMMELHSREMGVGFGCVPASFKLVKSNTTNKGVRNQVVKSSGNSNKKNPSVVVLMKVLRKLFLLHHHSQQSSAKKRPCSAH